MRKIQTSRIELLTALQDFVQEGIITDRDLIDRDVRKKNRLLKGSVKEIKAWLNDLTEKEIP
jgi:hypothetical protein